MSAAASRLRSADPAHISFSKHVVNARRHRQLEPLLRPADEGLGQELSTPRNSWWLSRLRHLGRHPATAPNPSESVGLQFLKRALEGRSGQRSIEGRLPSSIFRAVRASGLGDADLVAVASAAGDLSLDEFQRPKTSSQASRRPVHRNMHFAYKSRRPRSGSA